MSSVVSGTDSNKNEKKGERIAKRMARAGLCSRREAERWIEAGRVRVNDAVLKTPACVVGPGDRIVVDGQVIPEKEETRLFLYHKPTGLITSHKDEKGRVTVFDSLPEWLPRVISVGRLDLNSEGLLLLTNDGGLARYLELPSTGWVRRYRVRVHGALDFKALEDLKNGIEIEGVRYKSIDVTVENPVRQHGMHSSDRGTRRKGNAWLTVALREGKNREIRRVMEALGLQVNRLIRVSYGPFSLGGLKTGAVEDVKPSALQHHVLGYFQGQGDSKSLAQSSPRSSSQKSEKGKKPRVKREERRQNKGPKPFKSESGKKKGRMSGRPQKGPKH